MVLAVVVAAAAQGPVGLTMPGSPRMAAGPATATVVPRLNGRLRSDQLGLVINTADPYSVEVGEYYAVARSIAPAHVLRLELPVHDTLGEAEFNVLSAAVARHFGADVQALALAWTQPWAVQCNAITAALTLGFDRDLCAHTCASGRPSAYFNSASALPWRDLGLRPSMLLAAPDAHSARAMIDRGVASDGTLARRGAPPAQALLVATGDAARNVRARLYPAAGRLALPVGSVQIQSLRPSDRLAAARAVLLQTGAATLPELSELHWADGALADHLTSWGGRLTQAHGQATALDWIAAGATASHGTASEPCNHLQKFPHPQVLLLNYAQGATAIEAYWKSVAWPQQSVFVGEPLAAPFAAR